MGDEVAGKASGDTGPDVAEKSARRLEAALIDRDTFDLRVSEELNRRIIEAMPGGIVHVLIDGTIRTANQEALRILGLSYNQLTHKYTSDFEPVTIHEDGSPCSNADYPVTKALVTGEAQPPLTIGVRKPNGELSWAVFTAVPVSDPDTSETTGAIVTFLDITARRALEAEIVVKDRLAAVGTLAAGVGHEINNPLTYVLANLDWLRREAAEHGGSQLTRLDAAIEGVERIGRIVQDLGVFTETRSSEAGAVDVHDVLEASLRMAKADLRLTTRVQRSYHDVPYVNADVARLGQVFLNLLINAAHAIQRVEGAEATIAISTGKSQEGRVRVSIADNGGGIDRDVADRIFEPFFTTKPVGVGSGLGLYVCKHIVDSLGGDIRLENTPGRGATFHVELPAATRSSSSAPPIAAATDIIPARVLIVDDERGIRLILRDALLGHEMGEAEDGLQALALIEKQPFDVVLCDLVMPGASGAELFERVDAVRPGMRDRFVFLTGGAADPGHAAFLEASGRPVLTKPFGAREVRDAVLQVMRADLSPPPDGDDRRA